jgi:quercetin 2,3-dioxygenase
MRPGKRVGEPAGGDAVRFTGTGGQRVAASEPAEVLIWEMHATLGSPN